MRFLYTSLFTVLLPLVLFRLYWRGLKAPEYRKRWQERLAFYSQKYSDQFIWFHAVSVGEAEAVFPLIKKLTKIKPDEKILVTTTTPTGSARVQAVLGDTVEHVYFPYDIPWIINRFIRVFKPKILVIMEKEIWPNLFSHCGKQNIPVLIINARLSARSAKSYQLISSLIKPALAHVSSILTQTEEDREHFIDIGAVPSTVKVTGNIKFDMEVSESLIEEGQQLRRQLFPGRFVWIVASTHKGEEGIVIDAYIKLKQQIPELLLMLVPRHPERFESVQDLVKQRGLNLAVRSKNDIVTHNTDVYLADTMGELKLLYASADVAFVGGSLAPVGGHNILEPLAVGVPVMFGPYMFNFKEIADNVLSQQAAIQCQNEAQIIEHLIKLYKDESIRNTLVSKGTVFIERNKGATEKILAELERQLFN